jgi:DNA-binding transcriptional ArsR family regulator
MRTASYSTLVKPWRRTYMALRIHLANHDLRRVTVAQAPDVMLELVLSLMLFHNRTVDAAFDVWRKWAQAQLPRSCRPLLTLVSPIKGSPDFLTPPQASTDLDAGLDAILRTPRSRLRAELTRHSAPSAWTRSLSEGAPGALRTLGVAMRQYHDAVISPLGPHLRAQFDAALAPRMRALADGGLDAMLSDLAPGIHWRDPVLDLDGDCLDLDLHPGGRGLHLIPSFFAHQPMIADVPSHPVTVVYPIAHHTVWHPSPPRRGASSRTALASLIGTTRAAVLHAITTSGNITTTDLAQRTGISPATVSHHTAVLRQAGLILTRRTGTSVHHSPTPLGSTLARKTTTQ